MKCQYCGIEYTDGYNGYCSKKCYDDAYQKSHTKTCKICGKEYFAGSSGFGYKADGYCSETCHHKARLQYEKPRAEKALEKCKKEFEKAQKKYGNRIDKLAAAIRSNDPEAMLVARKGSSLKQAWGCLWGILRGIVFASFLVIFLIGLVNIAKFVRESIEHPCSEGVTTETSNATDAPKVGKQSETETVIPPVPIANEQKESTAVTAPIE